MRPEPVALLDYNLVITSPADGLTEKLRKLGSDVVAVPGFEQEGQVSAIGLTPNGACF